MEEMGELQDVEGDETEEIDDLHINFECKFCF